MIVINLDHVTIEGIDLRFVWDKQRLDAMGSLLMIWQCPQCKMRSPYHFNYCWFCGNRKPTGG